MTNHRARPFLRVLCVCSAAFLTVLHAATITFMPSTNSVQPGGTFTVKVSGTSAGAIGGYSLFLTSNGSGNDFQISGQSLNSAFGYFAAGPAFPQTISSTQASAELGAFSNSTLGAGTYLLSTVTIAVNANTAPGVYTFSNTASTLFADPTFVVGDAAAVAQFTINVGTSPAQITLGNLSSTYNGQSQPATATTTPSGLPVTFLYNNNATAPTQAGTYAVTATVAATQNGVAYAGSSTGTLIIAKAGATVTLGNLSYAYDGTPKAATAATTPAGLGVSLTYNGSATAPSAVGTYPVVATVTDANYQGSATGTLSIAKGIAQVSLGPLSYVYNGAPQPTSATTTPPGLTVDITYNGSATAPAEVGSYPVTAVVSDASYSGSATGTLVITKAIATVTLGNLSAVYDGAPKAATAATTPPGLGVTVTYNGSATPPRAAGSYSIVATISNANYQGSAAGTLLVAKAAAQVTLNNLSFAYDGSPKAAAASTIPAGLAVAVTYNGNASPPSATGSYAVVATVTDPNYVGNASGTLSIANAVAGVTLGNLSAVYDGTPKAATAVTTPPGLTLAIKYNGSATLPTAAGSYSVVATVTTANYAGSATGTLVIGKAAATVTLGNLASAYDGSPKSITATTSPTGLGVALTYNGSGTPPTAAGSYAVVATVSDPNYQGSATGKFVVSAASTRVVLGPLAFVYDGTPKSTTVTTTPAGIGVAVTYNGGSTPPVGAGSYAVVATVTAPNYQGSASGTLVIAKAAAQVTLGALAFPYDGAPKSTTATTSPAGLGVMLTYNGSAMPPTAAGSYPVVATVTDANYQGTATGTLVIDAVVKSKARVTLSGLLAAHDGNPHGVLATTVPPGLGLSITYDGVATEPTAIGKYAVVATIDDPVYTGSAKGTLVIGKGTARITLGNLEVPYTGAAQQATFLTDPPNLAVTLTYNRKSSAPISAGTYTVVGTIDDPRYAGSATQSMSITPTAATVTLSIPALTYNGRPQFATAATNPPGLALSITYNGSARAPINAGSYSVSATINSPNAEGSQTGTLVIAPAQATVALGGLSVVANGRPHPVKVSTVPARLAVRVTYNGSATAPSASGTYIVVATVANANYTGSQSGTLSILSAIAAKPALVAQKGDAAPGLNGATFDSFGEPVANRSGGVAFAATLTHGAGGIVPRDNRGIWAEDGAGVLRLVAQTGDAETGYLTLSDPLYNDDAKTAFVATYKAGKISATGIFCNSAGRLELVAQTGDQAPGCPPGATFSAFKGVVLPDRGGATNQGGVVFLAMLKAGRASGVSASNNLGIWAVDSTGGIRLIARTGDVLQGKTIARLALQSGSEDAADFAYAATFSDSTETAFDYVYPTAD